MIERPVIGTLRIAAILESRLLDAVENRVELGVAHVKGVVTAIEGVAVVEQQRRLVVDPHRGEIADALGLQPEDAGEEPRRLRLVARRNDGVIQDDRHDLASAGMLSVVGKYSAAATRAQAITIRRPSLLPDAARAAGGESVPPADLRRSPGRAG